MKPDNSFNNFIEGDCNRLARSAGFAVANNPGATAFNPLLLEAMSAGATVAGCKGGVEDLIIKGQTAVVFDPDDELSIYGSLQQLLNKREMARQLARGAQEHLRENYTVSKMVSSILQTYSEAQNQFNR